MMRRTVCHTGAMGDCRGVIESGEK